MSRAPDDTSLQIVAMLPRMRRFARSLTRSIDEADDLVQSACEKAIARAEQFEPGTRLDSWLFRIMHTTHIDLVRSSARRGGTTSAAIDLERVGFDARVHEQTEARSDLAAVRDEIERLPDDQRVVLALVCVDGLAYQQAADVLGVPIGTVMSRLSRARKRLAQAIDKSPQAELSR
jgi:RNA polymerase sigma-70 factor (ECF subfamily)